MNAVTRTIAVVLATAWSLGCRDVPSSTLMIDPVRVGSRVSVWVPPSTAVIVHAYYSGLDTTVRLLIRDADSWARIWVKLTSRRQPQPPLPRVDFRTEGVLVAVLGTGSTAP